MAKWEKKRDDEIPLTFFQSLIDQDLSDCFAQKPTDKVFYKLLLLGLQNMLHETLKANLVN